MGSFRRFIYLPVRLDDRLTKLIEGKEKRSFWLAADERRFVRSSKLLALCGFGFGSCWLLGRFVWFVPEILVILDISKFLDKFLAIQVYHNGHLLEFVRFRKTQSTGDCCSGLWLRKGAKINIVGNLSWAFVSFMGTKQFEVGSLLFRNHLIHLDGHVRVLLRFITDWPGLVGLFGLINFSSYHH